MTKFTYSSPCSKSPWGHCISIGFFILKKEGWKSRDTVPFNSIFSNVILYQSINCCKRLSFAFGGFCCFRWHGENISCSKKIRKPSLLIVWLNTMSCWILTLKHMRPYFLPFLLRPRSQFCKTWRFKKQAWFIKEQKIWYRRHGDSGLKHFY